MTSRTQMKCTQVPEFDGVMDWHYNVRPRLALDIALTHGSTGPFPARWDVHFVSNLVSIAFDIGGTLAPCFNEPVGFMLHL